MSLIVYKMTVFEVIFQHLDWISGGGSCNFLIKEELLQYLSKVLDIILKTLNIKIF